MNTDATKQNAEQTFERKCKFTKCGCENYCKPEWHTNRPGECVCGHCHAPVVAEATLGSKVPPNYLDTCSVGCKVPSDRWARPYYWHCRRCAHDNNSYKTGEAARAAALKHVVKCGATFYES